MNVSKSVRLIENIKSVVLVVLFLLTILLLYFFWGDQNFRVGADENNHPRSIAIEPRELFQPDRMEISFGGGTHTITNDNFELMMYGFRSFSVGRNLVVEEIPREVYEELIRRQSIRAVFEYFIPFSALTELHGIDRISGADNINAVSEIAYVAGLDDSLFVRDRRAGRYFRIAGTRSDCFDPLRAAIENTPIDPIYFPLATFVGGGIENNTLWPISVESNLHDISYSREDFVKQEDEATEIIRSFFGDNFDFVRRIEEANGTVMYMYGYGELVVVAHHTGVLEYRRQNNSRNAVQLSYLQAFSVANEFIAMQGGFNSINSLPLTPFIREVKVNPVSGQSGLRFIFGVKLGDGRVFYQHGDAMIIDVSNGEVSYFRRQMINFYVGEVLETQGEYRQVFSSMVNLIPNNTEFIWETLANTQRVNEEALSQDTKFNIIVQKTTRLDSGYVKIYEEENKLKAAWVVTIYGIEFYFDIESGEPLGYRL